MILIIQNFIFFFLYSLIYCVFRIFMWLTIIMCSVFNSCMNQASSGDFEIAEVVQSYERRLQEQVMLAKMDIISALELQIQVFIFQLLYSFQRFSYGFKLHYAFRIMNISIAIMFIKFIFTITYICNIACSHYKQKYTYICVS